MMMLENEDVSAYGSVQNFVRKLWICFPQNPYIHCVFMNSPVRFKLINFISILQLRKLVTTEVLQQICKKVNSILFTLEFGIRVHGICFVLFLSQRVLK